MAKNDPPPIEDDDDDDGVNKNLGDVIGDAWTARVYMFIGAIIGLLFAVFFFIIVTPRYTATMTMAPAERSGGTDIKALFPENSSFAVKYLVDSIGKGESTDFMRFEHILLGQSVARKLMAEPQYVVNGIKRGKQLLFLDGPTIGSAEELSDYMKSNVKVEPVGNTPLRRMKYLHPDSEFAVNFLEMIYAAADDIIKSDIKQQAIKRDAFFRKALQTEENPEHREALTSLLMEQEHILTMLAMDEPFAAKIVEPASTGIKPDWPPYPIVIAVFMFAGMFWNYGRFFKRYKGRSKSKRKRNFDE